jgi:hypothetical protein
VIKEETNDEVVLSVVAERTTRIRLDEIEERATGTVAIMPTGLEKQLTPQHLADLIVFLEEREINSPIAPGTTKPRLTLRSPWELSGRYPNQSPV